MRMPGSQALMHEARQKHGMALTDNTEILKVINMNKMQHQYIQNLQKANMTLKCKIKEVTELKTDDEIHKYADQLQNKEEKEESESEEDEALVDDDFEPQVIGTIEDMAVQKAKDREARRNQRKAKKGFYDRRSISRGPAKKEDRRGSYREFDYYYERDYYHPKQYMNRYDKAYYQGYEYQSKYDDGYYERYYPDDQKYEYRQKENRPLTTKGDKVKIFNVARKTMNSDAQREPEPKVKIFKSKKNQEQREKPAVQVAKKERSMSKGFRAKVSAEDLEKRSKALEEEKAEHRATRVKK